jgi:hypothetical protein
MFSAQRLIEKNQYESILAVLKMHQKSEQKRKSNKFYL